MKLRERSRALAYLAVMAALVHVVAAESLPDRVEALRFEKIATGTRVNTALLDSDGFFWLGSQTGLTKHNGYTFEHFVAGPSSIASNYVNGLYQDREGLIWIGTASGLSVYDKRTGGFTTHFHDPDNPHSISNDTITNFMLQAILEDRSGRIWIGTERGLNRFDKSAGGQFTRFHADPEDTSSLLDDWVSAIIEDSEGFLWIGTYSGLHRFDPDRGIVVERYSTSGDVPGTDPDRLLNHVSALLEASDKTLWVGTRGGLSRLDRASKTFTHYQNDPTDPGTIGHNFLVALLEDEEKNLWVTSVGGGLSILPPGSDRFVRVQYDPDDWRPDGISSNQLMNVFSDSYGAIWVVSLGGDLNRYDDKQPRFTVYRHRPGFRNSISKTPYIGGMIEDSDGALWIAVAATGLDRYDRDTDTFTHFRHEPGNPRSLPESYGQAVYEDGEGTLWLTSVNWITKLDRRTGEVIAAYPAENWPLAPGDDVHDPNILWMGTAGSGLLRLDKKTEETTYFRPDPDRPETSVSGRVMYDIHQEPDGLIWISTLGGGLDVFDPKIGQVIRKYKNDPDEPASLSSDTVYQFYHAPSGEYWVATDVGLDRFHPETGTFTHLSNREGTLPIVGVMSVIADRWGSLWLGGHEGLVRVEPSKNIHRYYGMNRGVLKNVGVVFRPLQTRDGELWFYDRGITRFRPESIREEPNLAPVFFTGFARDGESLALGRAPEQVTEIHLDWRENSFDFEVAALDYRNPAASRYRYRLKGVDSDWYEAGSERHGRYVGLAGGDYTLEAMAANEDDVWSQHVASVRVVVERPPWQTWWFRTVAGAAILVLAFGWYRRRVRNIELQKEQLEIQVEEKTREIRETQDQLVRSEKLAALGRLTAGIAHEINTPIGTIKSNTDIATRCVAKMEKAWGKVQTPEDSDDYRRFVDTLKESNRLSSFAGDRIANIVDSLKAFTRLDEAQFGKVDIHKGLDSAHTLIRHEFRDGIAVVKEYGETPEIYCYASELNQVFMTLLRNAAEAIEGEGMITLRTSVDENTVRVEISDSGKGIPIEQLKTLFDFNLTTRGARVGMAMDLVNAYNIVQNHRGELTAESEVGSGSIFTITLPTDFHEDSSTRENG